MKTKTSAPTTPASPMTTDAAARIQRASASKSDGRVIKDSFAARAQRAAAKVGKR